MLYAFVFGLAVGAAVVFIVALVEFGVAYFSTHGTD